MIKDRRSSVILTAGCLYDLYAFCNKIRYGALGFWCSSKSQMLRSIFDMERTEIIPSSAAGSVYSVVSVPYKSDHNVTTGLNFQRVCLLSIGIVTKF